MILGTDLSDSSSDSKIKLYEPNNIFALIRSFSMMFFTFKISTDTYVPSNHF